MASLFGLENKEVVRIKVKKCDGLVQPEYKKLCVDPQLTSFDILKNLLAQAFGINGREFSISYLGEDEGGQEAYLALLSDWDLDAAFLESAEPYLRLKVDLRPFEEGLEDWDLVAQGDGSQHQQNAMTSSLTSGMRGTGGWLLGTISNSVGKTVSSMSKAMGLKLEDDPYAPLKPPMNDSEFHRYLDDVGHMVMPQQFRLAVYQGGIEPSLRRVVWRHLLNIYPDDMNGRERFDYLKRKTQEYRRLRDKWRLDKSHGSDSEDIHTVTSMVKKDVLRTDRTHPYYSGSGESGNLLSLFHILVTYALSHPDVSYCQGMSDLASPILMVQEDEAHAYICFCGLMRRLRANFTHSGEAMMIKFEHLSLLLQHFDPSFHAYLEQVHAHDMLFCYRWLLLELKREFPLDDALHVLEVMWSSLPPDPPVDELPLMDDIGHSHKGPTLATHAYMRLRSLTRQAHPLSEGSGNSRLKVAPGIDAITPCDDHKMLDPSEFIPMEDLSTQAVRDTSERIDRSIESPENDTIGTNHKEDVIEEKNIKKPKLPGHAVKCSVNGEEKVDVNKCVDKSSNKPFASLQTSNEEDYNCKPDNQIKNDEKSCETFLNKTSGDKASTSSTDCPGDPEGLGSDYIDDSCRDSGSRSTAADSNTKRPSSIDLVDKVTGTGGGDSLMVSKPDVCSELSSCEEATEHPSIDFVSVNSKATRLPPPHAFGYGNPFLMFLCMTLLLQHRDHIMRTKMDDNELSMHFDRLVRRHASHRVLHQAQALFATYVKTHAISPDTEDTSSEDISV